MPPKNKYRPQDLSGFKTGKLAGCDHLVTFEQAAGLPERGASIKEFLASLPDLLGVSALHKLTSAILDAKTDNRSVVFALGGHVVKAGCSPVIIDLMERKFITALSMNGAVAIHDIEFALVGSTSEDVAQTLPTGNLGAAAETAEVIARASEAAVKKKKGLGEAIGRLLIDEYPPQPGVSMLAEAVRLGVPATVHVALGTDVVHQHPGISGAALGEASMTDFRLLVAIVQDLSGGVWLNVGSAVILPEVFLKALNTARNLGADVSDFTTGNMDMLQHYRPQANVLDRSGGKGLSITGHHEIMLPLLRAAILEEFGR